MVNKVIVSNELNKNVIQSIFFFLIFNLNNNKKNIEKTEFRLFPTVKYYAYQQQQQQSSSMCHKTNESIRA